MTRIKQRFSIQASLQALVVIIILPLIQVQGSSNSGSSAPPPPPAYTNRDYDESNEYEYAAAAPAGAAASDYYTDVDPRQQQQQASAYAAGETDPSADWGENQPYNTEGEPPYTDPEAPYYQQQQQQQGPPLSQKTPVFPSPIDRVPPTRTGPRGPFDKAQAASPKAYTPIHYQFPATTTATTTTTATATDGLEDDDDDDYQNLSQETSEFASARQDVITRYMTTRRGRLQLYACAGMVGGSLGAFFAKVCRKQASHTHMTLILAVMISSVSQSPFLPPCLYHLFNPICIPIMMIIVSLFFHDAFVLYHLLCGSRLGELVAQPLWRIGPRLGHVAGHGLGTDDTHSQNLSHRSVYPNVRDGASESTTLSTGPQSVEVYSSTQWPK
jgi:hypothetical protein